MKKIFAAILLIISTYSIFKATNLDINNNLISSIKNQDTEIENIFNKYNEENLLNNRLFISVKNTKNTDKINEIDIILNKIGYQKKDMFSTNLNLDLKEYITLLPNSLIQNIFQKEYVEKRKNEIVSLLNLPGTSNYFEYISKDPLGLELLIYNYFSNTFSSNNNTNEKHKIYQYIKTKEVNPEDYQDFYTFLTLNQDKFSAIGSGLYEFENYITVKSDIKLCIILSLIINLIIFFVFIRNIKFLILLLFGSIISYLIGIFFVSIFYTSIFAIVLAFTSTFISFNNEYLVHFSALNSKTKKMNYIGLTSAIGTTFIGFMFLLFAESVIIKQTAIITLGGMLGFLSFLFINSNSLKKMKFYCYSWRVFSLKKYFILLLLGFSLFLILLNINININTEISTFKYESNYLKEQRQYFENKSHFLNSKNTYAIKIDHTPYETFLYLKDQYPELSSHPFDLYRDMNEQLSTSNLIQKNYNYYNTLLLNELNSSGINININKDFQKNKIIDGNEFINIFENLLHFKWLFSANNNLYLVFSSEKELINSPELINLSPKKHYNEILTSLTKQMLTLTIIASIFMFIYLCFVQKNIFKVFYIFTPLLFSFSVFLFFLFYTGTSFNIIHMMGWAIVLTLSTDYTSVSVSWNHSKIELNKILLTGLSSCCSFSILMLAKSPLLFSLGLTVFIGTSIPLLFSIFLKVNYND